jgi:23S rRNA pseudouridine2605 synthase
MASENSTGTSDDKMRVAKRIAHAGLCSRREAERLIAEGRVAVNGRVLDSAALDVTPDARITVDGKPLPTPQPTRAWRYHKPRGRVTTHRDPEGRPTVFEALPEEMPRVVSVGRLDMNTEGLLLLTTNGELARHLELPATGWLRRYRVRARGTVAQTALDKLKGGVTIDGIRYGAIEARIDKVQGANTWMTVGLREGKNREIRRLMEHLGLSVNRLIRVSFGPFMLGDLAVGQVEEIKPRVLGDQLGPELARQFGLGGRAGHAKAKPPERGKPPRRKTAVRSARK